MITVNIDGVERTVPIPHVNIDGVWKTVDVVSSNVDGVWRETYPNFVDFSIDANNRNMIGYTGVENEELIIPNTFIHEGIMYKVTAIANGAFQNCTQLISVTLGTHTTIIGGDAFQNCTALTTINYRGSPEQWSAITIEDGNDCLTNATINYYYQD